MRYFRRSGPTLVLQESQSRSPRLVEGPRPATDTEAGRPGTIVAYDDSYPDEAGWAEQMAHTPGYYECDATGEPLAAPARVATAAPVVTVPRSVVGPAPVVEEPQPVETEEQPVSED